MFCNVLLEILASLQYVGTQFQCLICFLREFENSSSLEFFGHEIRLSFPRLRFVDSTSSSLLIYLKPM